MSDEAKLADELENVRKLVGEHIGPAMDRVIKRAAVALRAQPLGTQEPVAWRLLAYLDQYEITLTREVAKEWTKAGLYAEPLGVISPTASPPALVAQREALEFCRDFKITDGDGKEVTEDSLHEIRKAASRALNTTPTTGGETEG